MMSKNDNQIPQHVAIIMDGNRRWAKQRGLPAVAGHTYVVEELVERLIEHAADRGVRYLTLWAFSTENWKRAEEEVSGVLKLFRWALEKRAKRLIDKGARVRMIGDMSRFPDDIAEGFVKMANSSKDNTKINVTFALNYGGRDEVVRAVKKILRLPEMSHHFRSAQDDNLDLDSLSSLSNEDLVRMVGGCLDTAGMPDPDMIIRPGGEQRLSGFMLWQSEYAELYFTDVLMPDFDEKEFDKALDEYAVRRRRFGA